MVSVMLVVVGRCVVSGNGVSLVSSGGSEECPIKLTPIK